MKLAVVVGHSEKSPGARNSELAINEYDLNTELAFYIQKEALKRGIETVTIYRDNGYNNLPRDINKVNPHFCICVHHNAVDDKTINGTETLYYHKSETSRRLAVAINGEMVLAQGTRNRGCKGVNSENRGGYVLKYTSMPCILIEPYFISNDDAVITRDSEKLGKAIVDGFEKFLR